MTDAATPLEMSCEQVKAKLDNNDDFLLLDVREEDEYQTVHVEGATLVPMSQIQDRVGELDPQKDSEVVVYCHHGGRSMKVMLWLRKQGFSKAINMSGGIDEWAEKIDPSLPRY
ncbi:putative adenylyltransferase/sulfurtransferase MoeZ [Polystyrenella longa]|uniref:Putative adenylyltransferase/sulfurtransferase MoeZ n=1 Tax=Polystyrenella longa TaxID=2528007 RepID=A0A518CIE1_9PLAN|nr:rhodanese-like domain-containing protein [Polystyrenella longa]QDU78998.1 putative adenylyltransferase/sulfurtransferase MoeZ [Polystyrenella longa]